MNIKFYSLDFPGFRSRMKPWLRLSRLPNLLTLPGDILAGYSLGGAFHCVDYLGIICTLFISVLLYVAGLFLNDWFDHKIDASERPDRPIPSRSVSRQAVLRVSLIGISLALGLSTFCREHTFIIASILVLLIFSYNSFSKHLNLVGPMNMAACRVCNLLLGTSILGFPKVHFPTLFISIALVFIYISILSQVAKSETSHLPSPFWIWFLRTIPFFVLLNTSYVIPAFNSTCYWIVWSLFLLNTFSITHRIKKNTNLKLTSLFIGQLIRNLIFLQATIIASTGAPITWVIGILLLWPIAKYLSPRFYGS